MKVYTREEVNKFRDTFANLNYRKHTVELGRKEFSFFDVPQERNPALECFALVLAGKKDDSYVIGVSSQVETAFRPLWAFHEYVEVVEPGVDNKLKCVDALKQELGVARIVLVESDLPRYLAARKKFFANLFDYALGSPQNYDKATIKEFRESLDHLISLG
jgi:hypothetical protein